MPDVTVPRPNFYNMAPIVVKVHKEVSNRDGIVHAYYVYPHKIGRYSPISGTDPNRTG